MLDVKLLREDLTRVQERMATRGTPVDWDEVTTLDRERREALAQLERLKQKKNQSSGEIGKIRKSGGDASALMREVEGVTEEIRQSEPLVTAIEERFEAFMLRLPNLPHPDVTVGRDARDNKEVKRWREPTVFDFPAK